MKDLFVVRGQIRPRTDLLIALGSAAVLITLWCILSYGRVVPPLFLPSPTQIWEGMQEYHSRGWLIRGIMSSFSRVTTALLLVIVIGIPIGLLMGAVPFVDSALRKVVNGAKSLPTTGLIGLIVLWFALEEKAKIIFLCLGAVFYMIVMVRQAILDVSDSYIKVALDIGANQWQILTKVLLPGALPRIWDSIAVCNGIMWTYIVLAESINSNEDNLGVGYLLMLGSRTNDSGKVFGILFIVAIISVGTDALLALVRKRWLAW